MNLLNAASTLDLTSGGIPEVLKQTTMALSDLGHHIEIVTLDDPSAKFEIGEGIKIHALGPSFGKYHLNFRLIPWLWRNANRFDAILVHGLWQYHSLSVWLISRFLKTPYFVFVHGTLDPWFKHMYPLKHLKKSVYWPWGVYSVLRSANGVIYSTEEERRLASSSFKLYKANEIVVNIGISDPVGESVSQKEVFYNNYPTLRGKRLLLFMSRIDPKKGCEILIEAFSRISKENPSLHLVMAGPDQSNWMPSLQKAAQELNIASRITWTGMLKGDLKWGAILSAECLVLPSHSENFGVVIAESLACGVPVIITDKVNIWREIQVEGAGFVSTDDVSGVSQSLQRWLNLDDTEKERLGANAKKCFLKNFEINSGVKRFIEIIQNEM